MQAAPGKPLPLPSVFGRPISARERRTIAVGALISAAGLLLAYGVMPFARRWQAREEAIAAESERLERLETLIASEAQLRDSTVQKAAAMAAASQRLLSGRTPALAAAALQSALRGYADMSQLTVSQLDVAGAPDTTASALPMIPATLSAVTDIYGVADLLRLVTDGPLALELTSLSIRPNPALRGDLLQLTLGLRAPYLAGEEATGVESPLLPEDGGVSQAIVRANIFSASRKAPRARYRPFAAEPVPLDPLVEESPMIGPPVDPVESVPQLSGIMSGPNGRSALLRLDPAVEGAQLYREGDRGGAYRVLKINEQSVELSGPAGRVTLRLKRPEGQMP